MKKMALKELWPYKSGTTAFFNHLLYIKTKVNSIYVGKFDTKEDIKTLTPI